MYAGCPNNKKRVGIHYIGIRGKTLQDGILERGDARGAGKGDADCTAQNLANVAYLDPPKYVE